MSETEVKVLINTNDLKDEIVNNLTDDFYQDSDLFNEVVEKVFESIKKDKRFGKFNKDIIQESINRYLDKKLEQYENCTI